MPIWLRNFTFNKIKEYYEKQNEQEQPAPSTQNNVYGPDVNPTYSTKASK